MQTWERHHVYCKFTEIRIQLTRETKTGGNSRHGCRDKMVQISICWGRQFECAETDVVQGFIVNAVSFVGVFYKLVNGQGGVVWFYYCI